MNPGERQTVNAAGRLRYYFTEKKFDVLKVTFMPETEAKNRTITIIAPDNSEPRD